MQFWDYMTIYQVEKKNVSLKVWRQHGFKGVPSAKEYYKLQMSVLSAQKAPEDKSTLPMGLLTACLEGDWCIHDSPYYKVYPSISERLSQIDINKVDIDQITAPLENTPILARFAKGHEFRGKIKTLMFSSEKREGKTQIYLGFDLGEKTKDGNTILHIMTLRGGCGDKVGGILKHVVRPEHLVLTGLSYECVIRTISLVLTLCLIGDSPELIQPEVLNADEHKLTGQHNIEALVAKAKRRGKFGFTIGKDIEVMPHYRRPHLALVWYGKGRKKSKIIPRKGSIVHRKAVEKIPTGYAADEEKPVSDQS